MILALAGMIAAPSIVMRAAEASASAGSITLTGDGLEQITSMIGGGNTAILQAVTGLGQQVGVLNSQVGELLLHNQLPQHASHHIPNPSLQSRPLFHYGEDGQNHRLFDDAGVFGGLCDKYVSHELGKKSAMQKKLEQLSDNRLFAGGAVAGLAGYRLDNPVLKTVGVLTVGVKAAAKLNGWREMANNGQRVLKEANNKSKEEEQKRDH